ncbi:MAG: ABC transporter permease [Bacteroidetes bacterium]|nr:MAG: ABC transporter permease [Bacteroidota bacterium]TAG89585.1 MAG: ABC transporter permease [Bacteroidota bacterium]
MFDLDKWQEILHTMQKNKLRTFLTAFGVFWGIFMLVLLLGSGNGLQNGAERQFKDASLSSFWVWKGQTSTSSNGFKAGRQIQFTNADIKVLQEQIPELEEVAPRGTVFGEYVLKYKNKNSTSRADGLYPNFQDINGSKLYEGRLLNWTDEKERRKVTVLGKKTKEILFGKEENAIGKYIDIKGIFFQVVGVFQNKTNGGRIEERVYIPFSTFQYTFGQINKVDIFALTHNPNANTQEITDKIRRVMAKQHRFEPSDTQALGVNSNQEQAKRFRAVFDAIRIFVWVVGIGTLVAGIVGVSNIMMIIVKERTKEIGVRKALGATPFSVVSLILQESIFITSLAGYIGLLAGAGILQLMEFGIDMVEAQGGQVTFFYKPEINAGIAISAAIVLVIAGALAGLVPALQAARVKPIEALRAD